MLPVMQANGSKVYRTGTFSRELTSAQRVVIGDWSRDGDRYEFRAKTSLKGSLLPSVIKGEGGPYWSKHDQDPYPVMLIETRKAGADEQVEQQWQRIEPGSHDWKLAHCLRDARPILKDKDLVKDVEAMLLLGYLFSAGDEPPLDVGSVSHRDASDFLIKQLEVWGEEESLNDNELQSGRLEQLQKAALESLARMDNFEALPLVLELDLLEVDHGLNDPLVGSDALLSLEAMGYLSQSGDPRALQSLSDYIERYIHPVAGRELNDARDAITYLALMDPELAALCPPGSSCGNYCDHVVEAVLGRYGGVNAVSYLINRAERDGFSEETEEALEMLIKRSNLHFRWSVSLVGAGDPAEKWPAWWAKHQERCHITHSWAEIDALGGMRFWQWCAMMSGIAVILGLAWWMRRRLPRSTEVKKKAGCVRGM